MSYLSLFALLLAIFGGVCVACGNDETEVGITVRNSGYAWFLSAIAFGVVSVCIEIGWLS